MGAGVAVGVHGKHQAAGVVDKRVIDTPRVHAHGGERRAARQGGDGLGEAGLDLRPEAGDVPVVVAAERDKGVGEAVHFVEREAAARPAAEDDATTGGAEIDGGGVEVGGHGVIRVGDRSSLRSTRNYQKRSKSTTRRFALKDRRGTVCVTPGMLNHE